MKSVVEVFPGKALSSLAALTVAFVVFRAWNQDFTIDEANTYFFYLSGLSPDMWQAGSNNHLLSSLLIRVANSIFGFSPFAMRIPAMAGAVCFSAATAVLVSRLIEKSRVWARVCLYVLLAFNPFVMDYLVPARGYSPAMACEMAILAMMFSVVDRPGALSPALVPISLLAGLGVAFNYSFFFTFSALLFCGFAYVALASRPVAWRFLFAAGARSFGPFVGVIVLLCGQNIITMPKTEIDIGWGSRSFSLMFASFAQFSFNNPNPFLTPPTLRQVLVTLSQFAPWLALAMFAGALASALLRLRRGLPVDQTDDGKRERFILLLLCAFLLSFALHMALYATLGVKLPRSRTGIHWIPLITLFAASPLVVFRSGFGRFQPFYSVASAVVAGAIAIGFVFSLHFSYFQEWKWNADVCAATDSALSYANALHTRDVRVSWEFDAAGNFYGKLLGYGDHRLNEVPDGSAMLADDGSGGPTVYILSNRAWNEINQSSLTPVYESRLAGTIVALQHAPGATIPATPVHFNVEFHSRCHQHGWFESRKIYPGPITY